MVHVPAGPPVSMPKEDLAPLMGDLGDQLAVQWQSPPTAPTNSKSKSGGWTPKPARAAGVSLIQGSLSSN